MTVTIRASGEAIGASRVRRRDPVVVAVQLLQRRNLGLGHGLAALGQRLAVFTLQRHDRLQKACRCGRLTSIAHSCATSAANSSARVSMSCSASRASVMRMFECRECLTL